jgi:hypothetical protein
MNENKDFNIDEFSSLFYKYIIPNEKELIDILFNNFTNEDWIKLINIWKKSSSLLRYNNMKKEINEILQKYNIIINNYSTILSGIQYYVDKTCNT